GGGSVGGGQGGGSAGGGQGGGAVAGGHWSVIRHSLGEPPKFLRAVFATNRSEMRAVGDDGVVRRFTGSQVLTEAFNGTGGYTGVWASAVNNTRIIRSGDPVLRLTSSGATGETLPNVTAQNQNGIFGFNSADIWVVGGNSQSARLWHWNGQTWSSAASPVQKEAQGIHGRASNDVYATMQLSSVVHYDGSAWTLLPAPPGAVTSAIWQRGVNDLWVGGQGGTLHHFDGSTWTTVTLGPWGELASGIFTGIWGSGPDNAWAVGTYGKLAHFDGTSWSFVPSPTGEFLFAIHGTAADDIWAVGGNDTILHFAPGNEGDLCTSGNDGSCKQGLHCCYPCGTVGCLDRCTTFSAGQTACTAFP
ncbi:MAG: hypothetical protein K1X89_23800, partial [Myxococcaceae bacterium]|nr:hypothetical protein [Myxococcaceae bacterium]